jgi:hypothetical protein
MGKVLGREGYTLHFEQRYLQPSGTLPFSLLQNLHNTQQNGMSIEEYYYAFTRITGQLGSMVPKSSLGCESCSAKSMSNRAFKAPAPIKFRLFHGLWAACAS